MPFLIALKLLDALGWRWQIFWHPASQLLNCLAHLPSNREVCLVCLDLPLNILTAKLFFGLCRAKEIRGKLSAIHMIQNLLALLQSFAFMDISGFQAAVEAHISMILEYGKIALRNHTCIVCCVSQQAIVFG